METTATQELIFQAIAILLSGILTILGAYAKKFIQTKIDIEKYGFENDRVERIIDNAVNFAEAKGKQYAKERSKAIASSVKLDMARKYINKIDSDVIEKYGGQLDDMIERKVIQKFGA